MRWPAEIGVMVLPNVILFPQAFLPLYVFEPRYRRMLNEALHSHRLFCVAMQRKGKRGSPEGIAGVGLIRAARQHADGSSHLILQGLTRVELSEPVRYRPFRTHRIRVLPSKLENVAKADALAARLLELVADRLRQGTSVPLETLTSVPDLTELREEGESHPGMEFLAHVTNPEQIADLVSWALLSSPGQRQILLETLDVETRLRRLIGFLMSDQAPS